MFFVQDFHFFARSPESAITRMPRTKNIFIMIFYMRIFICIYSNESGNKSNIRLLCREEVEVG